MTDAAQEDRRVEYEALRAEILYSDQACMVITGALLSGSLTLLTLALDNGRQGLTGWLSPVWLIGYLYITEKRFVIETVAAYMRDALEPVEGGFGWETWLARHRREREHFRRFYPYYLESAITLVAMLAVPSFIYWRDGLRFSRSDTGLVVSLALVPVIAIVQWHNVRAYSRRIPPSANRRRS